MNHTYRNWSGIFVHPRILGEAGRLCLFGIGSVVQLPWLRGNPGPISQSVVVELCLLSRAVTRGCIDEDTPLLCENKRPSTYRGAWPVLHCCGHDWCNHNVLPTLPPWASHVEGDSSAISSAVLAVVVCPSVCPSHTVPIHVRIYYVWFEQIKHTYIHLQQSLYIKHVKDWLSVHLNKWNDTDCISRQY